MGKMTAWVGSLKLSEQSQREYGRECEHYEEWARERKMQLLRADTVLAYRQWRLLEDKPATLNRRMAILRSVLEEGVKREELDASQLLLLGDVYVDSDRSRPRPLTVTPLAGWAPSVMREYRDVALITYLQATGLPLTEALRLRTEDARKGEAPIGAARLKLAEHVVQRISEWLEMRNVASQWVFTAFDGRARLSARAMSRVAAWRIVSRRAKEVGVYVTPRLLRSQHLYDVASVDGVDGVTNEQAWKAYLSPRTLSRYRNMVRKGKE